MKRPAAWLLAFLLAGTAITPAVAQTRDTLRLVLASPTQTLDPHRTSSILSTAVLKLAFEQLTRIAPDGTVQPLLATSWKVEPDGLTWTVTLRQGVSFHDGTPFDAAAVQANFARLLDPKNAIPARTNLGTMTAAEAVDPATVRIRTSRPFSGLPIALSHSVGSMLSPKSLADGAADAGSRAIAGTGPFRIDRFALPDEVMMVRNDSYWGTPPKLQRIEARSRSDDQTRLAAFLAGEADVNFYLAPEGRRRVEAADGMEVVTVPSIRLFILHLPMALPEMQDVRVRRALNFAVDRNQIVRTLYQGAALPADAAIGPGVFGYKSGEPYPYDPARAAALLAEAGWVKDAAGNLVRNGQPFPTVRLLASRGRQPNDARLAQTLAGYLKAVGVQTTLQIDEFATFFAAARQESQNGTMMVQMAWGFPQMDGTAFLCSVYRAGNSYNFGRYRNERVEKECDAIDATFDPAERARLITEAAKTVYDDAAAVFLVAPSYLVGQRKGIGGLVLDPGENHLFDKASWQ